jgi:murein DD-endopeptidase MepM/ murein hydrolase activator NlpD
LQEEGRLNILIFSNESSRVRRLKISGRWIWLFLSSIWVLIIVLVFFATHHFDARKAQGLLSSLKEENQLQKFKLGRLADGMSQLESQVSKIREFDSKLRVVANLDPPPPLTSSPSSRIQEGVREKMILNGDEAGLLQQIVADLERLSADARVEQASLKSLEGLLEGKREQLASTPSILPTKGWMSSGFGYRTSPFTGALHMHEGIDISNAIGTPVVAPADGLVVKVGREYGYGKILVINHGRGIVTRYGHLHRIHAKIGQKIRRGDLIAEVGNTGRSTGPHLHYEVKVNKVSVDPRKYILF